MYSGDTASTALFENVLYGGFAMYASNSRVFPTALISPTLTNVTQTRNSYGKAQHNSTTTNNHLSNPVFTSSMHRTVLLQHPVPFTLTPEQFYLLHNALLRPEANSYHWDEFIHRLLHIHPTEDTNLNTSTKQWIEQLPAHSNVMDTETGCVCPVVITDTDCTVRLTHNGTLATSGQIYWITFVDKALLILELLQKIDMRQRPCRSLVNATAFLQFVNWSQYRSARHHSFRWKLGPTINLINTVTDSVVAATPSQVGLAIVIMVLYYARNQPSLARVLSMQYELVLVRIVKQLLQRPANAALIVGHIDTELAVIDSNFTAVHNNSTFNKYRNQHSVIKRAIHTCISDVFQHMFLSYRNRESTFQASVEWPDYYNHKSMNFLKTSWITRLPEIQYTPVVNNDKPQPLAVDWFTYDQILQLACYQYDRHTFHMVSAELNRTYVFMVIPGAAACQVEPAIEQYRPQVQLQQKQYMVWDALLPKDGDVQACAILAAPKLWMQQFQVHHLCLYARQHHPVNLTMPLARLIQRDWTVYLNAVATLLEFDNTTRPAIEFLDVQSKLIKQLFNMTDCLPAIDIDDNILATVLLSLAMMNTPHCVEKSILADPYWSKFKHKDRTAKKIQLPWASSSVEDTLQHTTNVICSNQSALYDEVCWVQFTPIESVELFDYILKTPGQHASDRWNILQQVILLVPCTTQQLMYYMRNSNLFVPTMMTDYRQAPKWKETEQMDLTSVTLNTYTAIHMLMFGSCSLSNMKQSPQNRLAAKDAFLADVVREAHTTGNHDIVYCVTTPEQRKDYTLQSHTFAFNAFIRDDGVPLPMNIRSVLLSDQGCHVDESIAKQVNNNFDFDKSIEQARRSDSDTEVGRSVLNKKKRGLSHHGTPIRTNSNANATLIASLNMQSNSAPYSPSLLNRGHHTANFQPFSPKHPSYNSSAAYSPTSPTFRPDSSFF